MRRSLVVLALVLCSTSEARVRSVRHPSAWAKPACTGIQGLASIRFLEPDGTVRKSYFHALNEYGWPITAGVHPNTLYTIYAGRLFESTNAGCSWTLRTLLPASEIDFDLYPSRDRIYVLADRKLARITGALVEVFELPARIHGMAVNPADSLHLRALGRNGVFYESRDGGIVWDHVSQIPDFSGVYSVAFDPRNFDHVVAGVVLTRGGLGTGMTTRDGGRTWTETPFPGAIGVLPYTIAFSPADPNVAWMIGFDVKAVEVNLYRSNDGATTFTPILQDVVITRKLAPHPHDSNVVATGFQGNIAIVNGNDVTIIDNTFWQEMVWAPSGTIYFTAPDEEFWPDP